jgi:hypothetical protein
VKYDEKYVRGPEGWKISHSDLDLYYFVPLAKGFGGDKKDYLFPA